MKYTAYINAQKEEKETVMCLKSVDYTVVEKQAREAKRNGFRILRVSAYDENGKFRERQGLSFDL